MLHYVGDATLDTFTRDCVSLLATDELQRKQEDLLQKNLEITEKLRAIEHGLAKAEVLETERLRALALTATSSSSSSSSRPPVAIQNTISGVYHRLAAWAHDLDDKDKVTVCRWRFHRQPHLIVESHLDILDDLNCAKCHQV